MSLLLAFSKEISHSEKVMYGCFDENSVRNAKRGCWEFRV